MTFHIIVSDDVHAELEFLIEWLESEKSGRGELFLNDYKTVLELIRKFPFAHRIKSGSYRIIKFPHFEYVLVYRIISEDIIIARLVHARSGLEKMFG